MKIYTKTGDEGETGLFGGPRVAKDDVRIEAYGTVDELNAALGLARSEMLPAAVEQTLASVQNELFAVGAELATPQPAQHGTALVGESHIRELELAIDQMETELSPLRQFIMPAGSRGVCLLHLARGICRRAERRVVTLARSEGANISPQIIHYLNRLSDYLFVAARFANHQEGAPEHPWIKPQGS